MQNEELKGVDNSQLQTLVIDETQYKTILSEKFTKRVKWQKPDEKKVFSVLPGTAKQFPVKKGDKVNMGDPIMVFEAMKMMNTIKAPISGTIKEFHVAIGDRFPKNTLLIEFQ
jgi:biotin carboxyl carrier protein